MAAVSRFLASAAGSQGNFEIQFSTRLGARFERARSTCLVLLAIDVAACADKMQSNMHTPQQMGSRPVMEWDMSTGAFRSPVGTGVPASYGRIPGAADFESQAHAQAQPQGQALPNHLLTSGFTAPLQDQNQSRNGDYESSQMRAIMMQQQQQQNAFAPPAAMKAAAEVQMSSGRRNPAGTPGASPMFTTTFNQRLRDQSTEQSPAVDVTRTYDGGAPSAQRLAMSGSGSRLGDQSYRLDTPGGLSYRTAGPTPTAARPPPRTSMLDEAASIRPFNLGERTPTNAQPSRFASPPASALRQSTLGTPSVVAVGEHAPTTVSLQASEQANELQHWVTVFGFPSDLVSGVLGEFRSYGDVLNCVSPPRGNWIHVRYRSRIEAQVALSKRVRLLFGDVMVGVCECTRTHELTGEAPMNGSMASDDRLAPFGVAHREEHHLSQQQQQPLRVEPQRSFLTRISDVLLG
ncbi:Nucleoporin NUP53 [Porphyridium purpureum]|uniref:Nucleoporin NUP53 n=1 Tax=Porphyridium purpureum TaxID=35688 RepID=A0A5J4YR06_PORPP|nr:Nucleoporin NUP53 [Porphyridium purpureum]|eukprot:POR4391..scf229_5